MQETGTMPVMDAPSLDTVSGVVHIPFKRLLAEPHEMFREARRLGPLVGFRTGAVLAIRAADVRATLTDPRVRQSGAEFLELAGISSGPFHDFARETMLLSHGPDHARRRAPLSRAFAFPLMDALRPQIRETARSLVAGWKGEVELRDQFSARLPAETIARILGLPDGDIERFTALVYAMSPGLTLGTRTDEFAAIDAATEELAAYVDWLLADRRTSPRDDFLSGYVARVDAAGNLSGSETIIQIVTVILGGSDTTRAAMTAMVSLLLEHPEQWHSVCADPARAGGAVAEALRFEPSVGSIGVIPLEPLQIGGLTIPQGMPLGLSTMSAMRDETLYADPDRFDISRKDHPRLHLVFGGGPHRCLGEALARAELEEGLIALTQTWPGLRLAGPRARMIGAGGIRSVTRLKVAPRR
jgi:cytochrome P450 family 103